MSQPTEPSAASLEAAAVKLVEAVRAHLKERMRVHYEERDRHEKGSADYVLAEECHDECEVALNVLNGEE